MASFNISVMLPCDLVLLRVTTCKSLSVSTSVLDILAIDRFFVSLRLSIALNLICCPATFSLFKFSLSPPCTSSTSSIHPLIYSEALSKSRYFKSTPLAIFSSFSFFSKSFSFFSKLSQTHLGVILKPKSFSTFKLTDTSLQAFPRSLLPTLNLYSYIVETSVNKISLCHFFETNTST